MDAAAAMPSGVPVVLEGQTFYVEVEARRVHCPSLGWSAYISEPSGYDYLWMQTRRVTVGAAGFVKQTITGVNGIFQYSFIDGHEESWFRDMRRMMRAALELARAHAAH